MAQVEDCYLNMHKALGSIPSTHKKSIYLRSHSQWVIRLGFESKLDVLKPLCFILLSTTFMYHSHFSSSSTLHVSMLWWVWVRSGNECVVEESGWLMLTHSTYILTQRALATKQGFPKYNCVFYMEVSISWRFLGSQSKMAGFYDHVGELQLGGAFL
jgi:drug/metabolite transporter superfamily protein YnfA